MTTAHASRSRFFAAFMVIVALAITSLAVASPQAEAVSPPAGVRANDMTFYAYVKRGEHLYISTNRGRNVQIRNQAGTLVQRSPNNTPTATADGVWQLSIDAAPPANPTDPLGFGYHIRVMSGSTERTGRIWTETDYIEQASSTPVGLKYWGVSDLGYQYEVSLHGAVAYTANIALRSAGAAHTSACDVESRSFDRGARWLSSYLDCGDKYRLFFEKPDNTLPESAMMAGTRVPVLPKPVTRQELVSATGVNFIANTDAVGGSFNIRSHSAFSGTVELQIDTNGNGQYNDSRDITRTVVMSGGRGLWTWNGKDAAGSDVTGGAQARVRLNRVGEAHLLLHDFEALRGVTMTRLNGEGAPNSTIYWDDRQLTQKRGSTTPVRSCLNGCNSAASTSVHGWAMGVAQKQGNTELPNSTSWGDGSVIDNWAYFSVNINSTPANVPALHTLTFNSNGGTLTGDRTMNRTDGKTWTRLPTPTRADHTFVGWFTSPTGGTAIRNGNVARSSFTAYAQWAPIEHTITYDGNGGTVQGATEVMRAQGGPVGEHPTVTRNGYALIGWYTGRTQGSAVTPGTSVSGPMTLYAQWERLEYDITYNANGGTLQGDSKKVRFWGDSIGAHPPATRTGYILTGWYTAPTGGSAVSPSTRASQSMTLYAQWERLEYDITYNANGGTLQGDSKVVRFHGDTLGEHPTATRTGHVFTGWTVTRNGEGTAVTNNTTVTGPMTLYAQWRPAEYNIVFDANPGMGEVTGATPSMSATYGCEDCVLSPNGFTKTTGAQDLIVDGGSESVELNSVFLGWSRSADSRTADIAPGSNAGQLSQTDGDTITLYAVWDDAPQFVVNEYPHRFFTLQQAQSGFITESELLSTVEATDRETNPLEHKTRAQVVSSGNDVGVTLYDYDSSDYTSLTGPATISLTYKVKDEVGSVAFLRIRVAISDGTITAPTRTQYLRGIAPHYFTEPAGNGGLAPQSLWRLDPTRQNALAAALDGHAQSTYCLNADTISELRDQVLRDGLGNSGSLAGLSAAAAVLRDNQGDCS